MDSENGHNEDTTECTYVPHDNDREKAVVTRCLPVLIMVKLVLVAVAIGLAAYLAGGPGVGVLYTFLNGHSEGQQTFVDCSQFDVCSVSPCVSVSQGCVTGNRLQGIEDTPVHEYLGIPFAAPPIGNLRFADPVDADAWDDVLNTTKYGPSCMFSKDTVFPSTFWPAEMWNPPGVQSEDCLYLNVWAPVNRTNLPVMVWIYGGGFYSGTSSLAVYNGSILASTTDTIVVSFNYRTAVLGFLSTGDQKIKGNFGLEDQLLALKWIKRNIASFGGDSRSIALFGESAGAASIGFHLLSSKSRGLFQRVILQSASATSPWAFMDNVEAKKRSDYYLKKVNCCFSDGEEILQCLRALPAEDLTFNYIDFVVGNPVRFPWVPTVDGSFLVDSPISLIHARTHNTDVDVIAGYNKNEATYWQLYTFHGALKETRNHNPITNKKFWDFANVILQDLPPSIRNDVIEKYSSGRTTNGNVLLSALDQLEGERNFICSVVDFVKLYSGNITGRGFLYDFKYRGSNEPWPEWMGVIHGAEIQWIFGLPLSPSYDKILHSHGIPSYTEEEKRFSLEIMKMFADFAKNGSPSDHWPSFTVGDQKRLVIGETMDFTVDDIQPGLLERCQDWTHYEQLSECCKLV